MKNIITYIFIIAASFAIYSCASASPSKGKSEQECDTCDTGGYYEDEILNRIYYQYLRYPKDKDEMLVLYKKEVLEMLTIHFSDPVTAKMAFEMSDSIRKNIPEDQELPEAYEYLFYYKGMEKDREYLEYIVEDECIIIRNHRLNKTEKNYKYDINKEVNIGYSSKYNSIAHSTFCFDKDDNPVSFDYEELSEWEKDINDATRTFSEDEICVMLEYANNDLHPYNKKYYKAQYDANMKKALPVVRKFLSNRPNISRIVFPIFVRDN